jgi:NTP pyrophosphatase (non-canonical NTP hydrolase)
MWEASRSAQLAAAGAAWHDLLVLMADLRSEDGCPWDREQSLASLRQYVREEAEEVCGAIDAILDYEAQLRSAAGMPPANPAPPEAEDRARTDKKGLTFAHHPHREDFAPEASASGAPVPACSGNEAAELDRRYSALTKEIGDLLLQSVFLGEVLLKMGRPGVEAGARAIVDKLVRRHPHVYGDIVAEDSASVLANWERIKQSEVD